jgi:hypothetical protein
MRLRPRLSPVLIAAASVAAVAAPQVPPHLADARAMVAHVAPADNVYVNGPGLLRWPGEDGATGYECKVTCSAFLTLLVRHAYHLSVAQVERLTGQSQPHADVWHDAIRAGRPGLHEVVRVADVRPGDVLAIKYEPDEGETGHVMLVDQPPATRAPSAPVVAGTTQYDVTVIDSTRHPHGLPDTRRPADGPARTGAGRGTIRIYARADGTVAGYTWTDSAKAEFRRSGTDRDMVIGRLDPAALADHGGATTRE